VIWLQPTFLRPETAACYETDNLVYTDRGSPARRSGWDCPPCFYQIHRVYQWVT
jgi:hypothetical protein